MIVNGYGDFERTFGALNANYPMGYAVRDFFLNGGSQAIIVRLFHDPAADGPPAGPGAPPAPYAKLPVGAIPLRAASPGKWGASLRASIDRDVSADVATALGLTKDDLFNLTVRDTSPGGGSEKFLNLSVKESARRADRVLKDQADLVRWDGTLDPNAPPAIPAASESDAVTQKEDLLATASPGALAVVEDELGRPRADLRNVNLVLAFLVTRCTGLWQISQSEGQSTSRVSSICSGTDRQARCPYRSAGLRWWNASRSAWKASCSRCRAIWVYRLERMSDSVRGASMPQIYRRASPGGVRGRRRDERHARRSLKSFPRQDHLRRRPIRTGGPVLLWESGIESIVASPSIEEVHE